MHSRHRLRKNEQFQEIFQSGQSFANRYLVLYYKAQVIPGDFRVGISVSKKVGNAVTRNRVKRLMKAVIAELSPYISSGVDLVFIARPRVVELDFLQMKQNIIHVCKNSGLYRG